MKSLLKIIFVFGFAFSFAQNVADYSYVSVPEKFGDKKVEDYGLREILVKSLKSKGYQILEGQIYKNDDNYCNVAFANVLDTSSFFKNKVTLQIKDCNDKILLSEEGKSFEKDFETGMPEALKDALQKLPASKPTNNLAIKKLEPEKQELPKSESKPTPKKVAKKPALSQGLPVNLNSKAEIFSNDSVNFNMIKLSETEFIFTKPNSSVPFAKFQESTKKGIYRVWLENGEQTLGYDEGNNIVVEIPQNDGSFKKEVFKRK